ncbi:MAG: helix-turn-helix domain-containing protein [Rhizomicrobium sp.]
MNDSDADRLYRKFGSLIRLHRENRAELMTQERLGQLVGLSRTSITNIEKGRQHISLHHLFQLAKALKVAPAALLPATGDLSQASDVDERLLSEVDEDIADWARSVVRK